MNKEKKLRSFHTLNRMITLKKDAIASRIQMLQKERIEAIHANKALDAVVEEALSFQMNAAFSNIKDNFVKVQKENIKSNKTIILLKSDLIKLELKKMEECIFESKKYEKIIKKETEALKSEAQKKDNDAMDALANRQGMKQRSLHGKLCV